MGIFNKSKTVKRNNKKSSEKGGDVVVKRLPLKSGSTVDQYLVEGVIGGGGFSIVYRCFDTVENQSVVLKEYFPNQLSRRISNDRIEPISEKKTRAFQVGMQQFFAEAHSLSQINHPNVINIINVFRAHNTAYMVSKLQAGKDLRWFIKRCQGDLDQAFVQKAIPPIMSGTSFQTLTPGFAPPEQHHKQQLGPGSDIYALGATIYACITGRPPPTSLKREEKSKELTLRGAEKKITTTVIEAIRWALEMDISKRPQTLEEFADLFLKDSEWESFAAYEADLLAHAAE